MARKTNGSAVRSKKIVSPPVESVSAVPNVGQVSTEVSTNAPAPVTAKAVAVTSVSVRPVTPTSVMATPVATTKTAPNGNKPNVALNIAPHVAPNVARANVNVSNLDEEIRRRAYELFVQRNGAAGDPNRDWLVAESEVKARHAVAGR